MKIDLIIRKIEEATEWTESRPTLCILIASAVGLAAGLIVGAAI
jgi:hypothetical protein